MNAGAPAQAFPSKLLRNVAGVWFGPAAERALLASVDVLVSEGRVTQVGSELAAPDGCEVIEAAHLLVLPGFVNAHHHLTQQLTRTISPGGDVFEWLAACYPVWARLTAAQAGIGARIGLAELALTGVTTTADLSYYFPAGRPDIFDAQIEAARDIGIRMLAVRGGMLDVGDAVRGRIGDSIASTIESPDTLLAELERAATQYHGPAQESMLRIGMGLTEPLWEAPSLMRELAALAEAHGLAAHTHLHPRPGDLEACAPGSIADRLAELGWWNDRLWVAHGTRLDAGLLDRMIADGVGFVTCPSSNARLGTSLAPAWRFAERGGLPSIGVDGAASNDGGDMLGEIRLTWQIQRHASSGSEYFAGLTPRTVLDWATVGGAKALGWQGLGELTIGGLADLACFDVSGLEYVGAQDLLDALVLCGVSHRAELVLVGGKAVVRDGRLVGVDEDELAHQGRAATLELFTS